MFAQRMWRRPAKRLERLQAGAHDPSPVRQLVDILNAVFAEHEDQPLQRAIAETRLTERGDKVVLVWKGACDPLGKIRGAEHIDVTAGTLNGTQAAEAAMTVVLGSQRAGMLTAAGVPHTEQDPAWAFLIPQTHLSLLQQLGIGCQAFDGTSLLTRIENAVKHKGGYARLTMRRHVIGGTLGLEPTARPHVEARSEMGLVRIGADPIPQTVAAAFVGRPLDDFVVIGGGAPGVTITEVESSATIDLGIRDPLVPLAPVPAVVQKVHDTWKAAVEAA